MRIKQLAAASGLPKTTIHYYTREGLLHPPAKSSANSATYDASHLARLRLISQLRSAEGGALPVFHVKRAIELIDAGVPVERAVGLQVAVMGAGVAREAQPRSPAEVCAASGLSERQLSAALAGRVLAKAPQAVDLDTTDAHAAVSVRALLAAGIRIEELESIAEMVRAISAYEMALAARLVAGKTAAARAEIYQALQTSGNAWHEYLFLRARQHDIADGLGTAVRSTALEQRSSERSALRPGRRASPPRSKPR
jgi:hypothetical protein